MASVQKNTKVLFTHITKGYNNNIMLETCNRVFQGAVTVNFIHTYINNKKKYNLFSISLSSI